MWYRGESCLLGSSGTYGADCSRNLESGRKVVDDIRSLVNGRDLQLESGIVFMEFCLYLFLYISMKHCYGRRRRDLESGLYRWTTSEVCWVF